MIRRSHDSQPAVWLWTAAVMSMLLVPTLGAEAKIPPFTVELTPEQPVAGESAAIEVVLDMAIGIGELGQLVRFERVSSNGERDLVTVDVALAVGNSSVDGPEAERTYIGTVTFPVEGRWTMAAAPWIADDQTPVGYPPPTEINVRAAEASAQSDRSMRAALVTIGAIGLSLALGSRRLGGSDEGIEA